MINEIKIEILDIVVIAVIMAYVVMFAEITCKAEWDQTYQDE